MCMYAAKISTNATGISTMNRSHKPSVGNWFFVAHFIMLASRTT